MLQEKHTNKLQPKVKKEWQKVETYSLRLCSTLLNPPSSWKENDNDKYNNTNEQ